MAVLWAAGIGAATSIIGGIMGSNQAQAANDQAAANYAAQRAAAEAAARQVNEYNKKVFEADKENYKNTRDYEWETNVRNWQYNTELREYEYLQTARQYLSSTENTQQQLTYNSVAAQQAQEQEQASLAEILNSDAFQREGMLVEQIQNEGRAALLQAGNSRAKALQSTIAEQGRNAAILSASLLSAGQQSQRNMRDIALSRYADDLKARNAMMISPERLPELPQPTLAPERIFVEPMKATAAFVPAPLQQNTFLPIIQGIAGGANMMAGALK